MTFAERLKSVIDKNQKLFSYKCQILPHECQLIFECRGAGADDEAVVKTRMVNHLLGHLCNLEKSVPNIKISSSRRIKSRNRTAKIVGSGESVATTTTTTSPKAVTARKGASRSKMVKVIESNAEHLHHPSTTTITIQQQSVITATPLDMTTSSTTNTSSAGTTAAITTSVLPPMIDDRKQMLVLKFFEEDHSYTMTSTRPAPLQQPSQLQTIQLPTSVVIGHNHPRSSIIKEALTSAGIDLQPQSYHPSVITSAPTISQTLEIRTSTDGSTAIIEGGESTATATSTSSTSSSSGVLNIRALALDYIDDIRKKSSSAAKSIIVNGDKSLIYQCKICPDKQFTSTNGLIFHYKKHAGLKPYVCELCSATFTRQHSLNYHMLIHMNKSRFVCSDCGRHFRHPSHFKEHMRRHTGETPFQCGDCLIR